MRYEFHCGACGRRFELDLPVDRRDKPTHCPDCGALAARLMSAPAGFPGADSWRRSGAGEGAR